MNKDPEQCHVRPVCSSFGVCVFDTAREPDCQALVPALSRRQPSRDCASSHKAQVTSRRVWIPLSESCPTLLCYMRTRD